MYIFPFPSSLPFLSVFLLLFLSLSLSIFSSPSVSISFSLPHSIETHFDDNIVGNWRSHRRHSIHTATNAMKNINPNASNVKFIAYNVAVAFYRRTSDTTRVFRFNLPWKCIAFCYGELIGTILDSNVPVF